jgi:tRNA(Ile)-lysidine synthase
MSVEWLDSVRGLLERWVSPGDRMLVGVSGGADSTALLALLTDEMKIEPSRIVAAHVNHGIREDAALDLDVVEHVASKRSIVVAVRSVDAPGLAQRERFSLEMAARKLRYAAFDQMAKEHSCSWILTGHTMEDSAETVLMRLRGRSPWYECTGIPDRRGTVLRPLLGVHRDQVRAWAAEKGVRFRDDESNLDARFRRNRLRELIARNDDFWSYGNIEALSRAGESVREEIDRLRRLARVLFVGRSRPGKGNKVGLAIDEIFRYFTVLTFVPVEVAWAELAGEPEARLPSAHRRMIMDCLTGRGPQASIQLPNDVTMVRRGKYVWLGLGEISEVRQSVSFGTWRIAERDATLVIELDSAHEVGHDGAIKIRLNGSSGELSARSWKAGDILKMPGRPTKKIADILAEKKLDPFERARVVVLADLQGPLMILGGPVAARALPTTTDKHTAWVSWKVDDGSVERKDI